MGMDKQIYEELVTQHDELRTLIANCEELAEGLDAQVVEPETLLAEVARLRIAFQHHNRFEERLLRPLLPTELALIAHIDEHHTMNQGLGGNPVTAELRATIARIRNHLSLEERYFAASVGGAVVA